MKTFTNIFNFIVSSESLFTAWKRFRRDKGKKADVATFEWDLERNIFQLHRDLVNKTYRHGSYEGFYITDPKRRHIHKATVRDRVLHHAVVFMLTPIFEPMFINNSFSCRVGKGTHKGVRTVDHMARKVSKNYTRPCFALKCDIKKFFDSIDHDILLNLIDRPIKDADTMWLLREILGSFSGGSSTLFEYKGVPIGNLTSQLFANVYMNEFDQFMKHELKVKYYARYTDDFVVLSDDIEYLKSLLTPIEVFLKKRLQLALHPRKVSIGALHQGIDFLGYVVFPHHRRVRHKTKKRMFRGLRSRTEAHNNGMISKDTVEASLNSYLGALSHANAYKESQNMKNSYWFWLDG